MSNQIESAGLEPASALFAPHRLSSGRLANSAHDSVEMTGVEPALLECKSSVFPLHHNPEKGRTGFEPVLDMCPLVNSQSLEPFSHASQNSSRNLLIQPSRNRSHKFVSAAVSFGCISRIVDLRFVKIASVRRTLLRAAHISHETIAVVTNDDELFHAIIISHFQFRVKSLLRFFLLQTPPARFELAYPE